MASIHKDELIRLAEEKAADANLLLLHERFSSSYYLAGYAVEIGLKVVIATEFERNTLPDRKFVQSIYTHKLVELVALSGLMPALKSQVGSDARFDSNWAVVAAWTEEARYQSIDALTATAMYVGVTESDHGVLPWLRTYW